MIRSFRSLINELNIFVHLWNELFSSSCCPVLKYTEYGCFLNIHECIRFKLERLWGKFLLKYVEIRWQRFK